MLSPRIRPRFEMRVPFSATETLDRLKDRLDRDECPCTGTLAGNHLHLNMRPLLQKIWSPHLNLEVVGDRPGAIINGHFGPRPDIWTLVMALYAISGFLVLMGLLFAASQWMLDMTPSALWLVAGAVVLGGVVYGLALAGQVLSQDQMEMLLRYVREAVGADAVVVEMRG
ncbi:MAG: hypothetical protein R2834_09020 [Rhodothermales bacterium]